MNGGTTWLTSDVRLETDTPGAADSGHAGIAASGNAVYVVWEDQRDGQPDIHFNRSPDRGASWFHPDFRLDTDSPGAALSHHPQIAVAENGVYVSWLEWRTGGADVYFTVPFGIQPFCAGTPGCNGLTPALSSMDAATIGNTVTLGIADGVGGSSGFLLLPVATALQCGSLLVGFPAILLPLGTVGGTGCGAGTGSFPAAIPANPLLFGIAYYFQAILVDLSAPGGFSTFNGLEMWVG